MADACLRSELTLSPVELQARIAELQRQIEAQRKVNEVLIRRVAKSVEIEGGAFELHEQNTQLQHSVELRARELEHINRQLRQEISERKLIEQSLRMSEERYRLLMEESEQPFAVVRDFNFVYANPAAAHLLGYATPDNLISSGLVTVVPPDELMQRRRRFDERLTGADANSRYEARFVRADGREIWCEVSCKIGEFEGKVAMLAGLHDITERKLAAAELARINSTLMATLESTADAILVVDGERRITNFNEKFVELWGVKDRSALHSEHLALIAVQAKQLTDPEDFVARTLRNYVDPLAETFDVMRFVDGRVFERYSQPQRVGRDVIGRVWSYRDVTERARAETLRQQLESQLRQAQKMEAIGTLAGGIAHDFNNILYAIQGYAELVLDNLPAESQARHDQQEVLVASRRAADLVRQILAFSRQSSAQSMAVDVATSAREVLRLMRASLPSAIEVRFEQQCESPVIMADGTHIHQILMNLCTNAGHAIGEDTGLLQVSLRSELVGPGMSKQNGLAAGPYLVISVQDNGCGIPKDVQERIFDPFFTTKEVGVGTGLGLSTVHGIVSSLGGTVQVESVEGQGTLFEVYLPQAAGVSVEKHEEAQAELIGSGLIMFVEDEEPIARMCTEALKRFGYTVDAFTSSTEAWERFAADPYYYDLVITDQSMPELTGAKLAERMLKARADLPIILCTGFSKTITPSSAKLLGVKALLEKPIGIRDLAAAVGSALGPRKLEIAS